MIRFGASLLKPPLHSPPLLLSSRHPISVSPMAQVIVVGGGLAGLSAAHTLLERGANVLLLDKQGCVSFHLFFSALPTTIYPLFQVHGW